MKMLMRFPLAIAALVIPLGAQSLYYLPQVIDGAAPGGSLRTTFILANTSAANAIATISLTHYDGSPLQANFLSLGAGSRFSVTLTAGGTAILQTDGGGDGSPHHQCVLCHDLRQRSG